MHTSISHQGMARLLVTLALFTAACSDPASRLSAPAPRAIANASRSLGVAAAPFAILANATVTCTDGSIIGDVGTFEPTPTGSVNLGLCPVTGTVHVGDVESQAAFTEFLGIYASLAPKPGDTCTILTGTLAGITLAPGSYCFDAEAALTGVLTLDGSGFTDFHPAWDFKIGTSGTGELSGTNLTVVMAGGGNACNVTWWVAQGSAMTTSDFKGNILAGGAVTFTDGSYNGNAWASADATVTRTAITGC